MNTFRNWLKNASVLSCIALSTQAAMANPEDGRVTSGTATIVNSGSTTTISQYTDRVIINWNRFSIGPGELTRFIQPNELATALNRVTGVDPSVILGSLQSNGRIFLLNPNGILFGPGAQVNVGGLLASSLSMNDDDFLAGNYRLFQDPDKAMAYVINQGQITAEGQGSVILVAPLVSNEGVIVANLGKIELAAGTEAVVDIDGAGLINLALQTNPGDVRSTTLATSDLLASVVNHDGVLEAGSVSVNGEQVVLHGAEGLALNSGTLRADQGQVAINSSQTSVATAGSLASADGGGGDVRLLSEGNTVFAPGALLTARGGDTGGFVEVSGQQTVWVNGQVDTTAANGELGEFLIDPANLTIVNGAGPGTQDGVLPDILFGDPDLGANTVSEAALEALGAGSNIILQATDSITVNDLTADGNLTLSNNSNLTMQAQTGSVTFVDPTNTIIASGTGTLTVEAGTTATLGNLVTGGGAIEVTAGGDVTLGGQLDASAGSVLVTSGGSIDLGQATLGVNPAVQAGTTASLVAGASILGDLDDGAADIVAPNVTLQVTGTAGTPANPLELTADNLAGQGGSFMLTTTGAITLDSLLSADTVTTYTGITGSDIGITTLAGDLTTGGAALGDNPGINATGLVSLVSAGAILGDGDDGFPSFADIVADQLTAEATNFLGSSFNYLELDVNSAAGTGDGIFIYLSGDLTLDSITSLAGTTVDGMSTPNDAEFQTFDGFDLNLAGANLGNNPALTAGNTASIEFFGSDLIGDLDDTAADIVAVNLTLAGDVVGTAANPIDIDADFLAGNVTNGEIRDVDSVTLDMLTTADESNIYLGLSAGVNLGISTLTGDINLDGPNLGTQSAASASGLLSLNAAQDIIGDTDDTDSDLRAEFALTLQAGGTIGTLTVPVEFDTRQLAGATQGAGMFLVHTGFSNLNVGTLDSTVGTNLVGLTAENVGDIMITSPNSIGLASPVTALGDTVSLQAQSLLDNNDAAADVLGGDVILETSFNMGNATDLIEIDADRLAGMGSSVFLLDTDGVMIDRLTSLQGTDLTGLTATSAGITFYLGTTTGDIDLDGAFLAGSPAIAAPSLVILDAGGGILGDLDDAAPDITAVSLVLQGGGTAGDVANPLETQTGVLAGDVTGGVNVINTGGVVVDQITDLDFGTFTGLNSLTSVGLTTVGGDIDLGGAALGAVPAVTGVMVSLSAGGSVLSDTDDTNPDVSANTGLTLEATSNVGTVADPLEVQSNALAASANLIILTSPSSINVSTIPLATTGANLVGVTASGDVSLTSASSIGTASPITALGNTVSLSAGGSIVDLSGVGLDMSAGSVTLEAAGDIGTDINPLELDVTNLAAATPNGIISVQAANGVTVDTVARVDGSGNVAGVTAGAAGAGDGDVRIGTTLGSIVLNQPVTALDDTIGLLAPAGSLTGVGMAFSDNLGIQTQDDIGSMATPFDTDVTVLAAHSTQGEVWINETDTTSADGLTLGNIFDIVGVQGATTASVTVQAGDLNLSDASLGNDPAVQAPDVVSLNAVVGSIQGDADDALPDVVSEDVTLEAGGAIGATELVELSADNVAGLADSLFLSNDQSLNVVAINSLPGTSLTGLRATAGDALVQVVGDLNLGDVSLGTNPAIVGTGTVSLVASPGSVLGDTDDQNPDIQATNLTLDVQGNAGVTATHLEIAVTAVAGSAQGSIILRQSGGDLTVAELMDAPGNTVTGLTADSIGIRVLGANLFLGDPSLVGNPALTATGTVSLATGGGDILGDTDDTTPDIVAQNLEFFGLSTVGTATDPLDVDVDNLAGGSEGGVFVLDADEVLVSSVTSVLDGSVENGMSGDFLFLATLTGDITLADLSGVGTSALDARDTASLRAAGNVVSLGSALDIEAPNVTLEGLNVGTAAAPITLVVPTVNLAGASSDFFVSVSDTVHLTRVTTADGTPLNGVVSAGGNVGIGTLAGDIRLGTNPLGANPAVSNASGVVSLNAFRDVIGDTDDTAVDIDSPFFLTLRAGRHLGTNANPLEIDTAEVGALTGTGSVFLVDPDDLIVCNVLEADGVTFLTGVTAGGAGNISIVTGGDLTLESAATAVGSTVSLNAGGAILDDFDIDNDVVAASATLEAVNGVGTDTDPIHTSLTTVAASATNTGVFLEETNGLTVGTVTRVTGGTLSGVTAGTAAIGDGDIILQVNAGDLTLDQSVTADGDAVGLFVPFGGISGAGLVTSRDLGIQTQDDIGSAITPFDTDVRILAAQSTGGAVFINETDTVSGDGLIIGNVLGLAGITAVTDAEVTVQTGNLVLGDASLGADPAVTAGDEVSLTAVTGSILGDTDDSTLADVVAGTSLTMVAGTSIGGAPGGTDTPEVETPLLAAQAGTNVLIQIKADVTLDAIVALDGTTVTGVSATTGNAGLVTFGPGFDFNLDGANLGNNPALAAGTLASIRNAAVNGDILGDADDTAPDIVAPSVWLGAINVGTAADPIELGTARLAGSGFTAMALTNDQTVTLDRFGPATGGVIGSGLLAGNRITLTTTAGDISLDGPSLGATLAVQSVDVALTAAGSIVGDTDDTSPDIAAADLVLQAGGSVGTVAIPLEVSASNVAALATSGSVVLTSGFDLRVETVARPDGTTLTGIVAGTDVSLFTTQDIILNQGITATDDTVSLDAVSITGDGVIAATDLTLEADTGIDVETSVDTVAAQTTAGDILIEETNGLTVGTVTRVTGGDLVGVTAGAAGVGGDDVAISVTDGDLTLNDPVIALDDTIALIVPNGAIIDNTGGVGAQSANLGLLTMNDIGANGAPFVTDVTSLAAVSTGGEVFVQEVDTLTADGLTIDSIFGIDGVISTGLAQVTVDTGDLNLNGATLGDEPAVTGPNGVSLNAVTGSIVGDTDDTTPDVVTSQNLILQAAGDIGTPTDPLEFSAGQVAAGADGIFLSTPDSVTIEELPDFDGVTLVTGLTASVSAAGLTSGGNIAMGSGLGANPGVSAVTVASLTAAGDILADFDDTAPDLVAPSVTLVGDNVGTALIPVEIQADNLAGSANGTMFVVDANGVVIDQVQDAFGTGVTGLSAQTLGLTTLAGDIDLGGASLTNQLALQIGLVGSLVAAGDILGDTDDTTPDIEAASLTLEAGGNIGSLARPLELDAAFLAGSTTSGSIILTAANTDLTIDVINRADGSGSVDGLEAGGAGDVSLVSSAGIDIQATIRAADDTVSLNAGTVLQGGTAADVVAADATLEAGDGIDVEISVDNLAAAAGGNIQIDDNDTLNVGTVTRVTGGDLVGIVAGADGNALISVGTGDLTLSAPVSATEDLVGLAAFDGGIVQSMAGTSVFAGDFLAVTADDIGAFGVPLLTDVSRISALSVFGNVFLTEDDATTNDGLTPVTLGGVSGLDGVNVAVLVTSGDLDLGDPSLGGLPGVAGDALVSVRVLNGDILGDTDDTAADVLAGLDLTMRAPGGDIGTPTTPIDFDSQRIAALADGLYLQIQDDIVIDSLVDVDGTQVVGLMAEVSAAGLTATGAIAMGAGLGNDPAMTATTTATLIAGLEIVGDADDTLPDVVAPNVTLSGEAVGISANPIEVDADRLAGVATEESMFLVDPDGVVLDQLIDAFGNTVTGVVTDNAFSLTTLAGDIDLGGASLGASAAIDSGGVTQLIAAGEILGDGDDAVPDILATSLQLTAGTNIGTVAQPLELNSGSLAALTTNGDIVLEFSGLDPDDRVLLGIPTGSTFPNAVTAGGTGNISITSDSGIQWVDRVLAENNTISLQADGTLFGNSGIGDTRLEAQNITLESGSFVIVTLLAENLAADVAGPIVIDSVGFLNVSTVTRVTGGDLVGVTATGVGSNVQIATFSGNLNLLQPVTALDNRVLLYPFFGSLTSLVPGTAVSAADLEVFAAGNVGSPGLGLRTDVTRFSADTQGMGSVFLLENDTLTGDGLTIGAINLATGVIAPGVDITVVSGDLNLGDASLGANPAILATALVNLETQNGSILGDPDDVATDIAGTNLRLQASGSVGTQATPLETDVVRVAASGPDGVFLVDQDSLTVASVLDVFGNPLTGVVSGGNVLLGTNTGPLNLNAANLGATAAVTATGTVSLAATGAVIGDTDDAAPDVIATQLTLQAGGDAGTLAIPLDLQVAQLAGDVTGSVHLVDPDGLALVGTTALNGAVLNGVQAGGFLGLLVDTGDIDLSSATLGGGTAVTAGPTLSLQATTGSILGDTDDAAADVRADSITLVAGSEVGSAAAAVDTDANFLAASGANVFLHDVGDVTINQITDEILGVSVLGVQSPGMVGLQADGSLGLDGALLGANPAVQGAAVSLMAGGNILGDADDAVRDIVTGPLTLQAGGDAGTGAVPLETTSTALAAGVTGSLVLSNDGPLTVDALTSVFGAGLVGVSAGEDLGLQAAAGDIRLDSAGLGSSSGVTAGDLVSLVAAGNVVGDTDDDAADIQGQRLTLQAGGDAGTGAVPLDTNVGALATGVMGSVVVSNDGGLVLDQLATNFGNLLSGVNAGTSAGLRAESGDLDLNGAGLASGPAVTAGTEISLAAAGDINGDGDDTAPDIVTGNLTLQAGGNAGTGDEPLDTDADTLAGRASGVLAVSNAGTIRIGALNSVFGEGLTGIFSDGDAGVRTLTGDINLDGAGLGSNAAIIAGDLISLDAQNGNINGDLDDSSTDLFGTRLTLQGVVAGTAAAPLALDVTDLATETPGGLEFTNVQTTNLTILISVFGEQVGSLPGPPVVPPVDPPVVPPVDPPVVPRDIPPDTPQDPTLPDVLPEPQGPVTQFLNNIALGNLTQYFSVLADPIVPFEEQADTEFMSKRKYPRIEAKKGTP